METSTTSLITEGFKANPLVGLLDGKMPKSADLLKVDSQQFKCISDEMDQRLKKIAVNYRSELKTFFKLEDDFSVSEIRKTIKAFNENLKNALKMERDYLHRVKDQIQGLIDLTQLVDQQLSEINLFFEEIKTKYPKAEILDLDCLTHFKLSNGLPRCALFNPNDSATCHLRIIGEQIYFENLEEFPYIENNNGYYRRSMSSFKKETKPLDSRLKLELAKEISKACIRKGEFYAIDLRTTLPTPLIPAPAREIIRQATDSKIFDNIALLAEVQNWEVEYYLHQTQKDSLKPKIKGEVNIAQYQPHESKYEFSPTDDRDPLILGLKTFETVIGNRTIAVLIGAFDLSKMEEWIKDEMAEKI